MGLVGVCLFVGCLSLVSWLLVYVGLGLGLHLFWVWWWFWLFVFVYLVCLWVGVVDLSLVCLTVLT